LSLSSTEYTSVLRFFKIYFIIILHKCERNIIIILYYIIITKNILYARIVYDIYILIRISILCYTTASGMFCKEITPICTWVSNQEYYSYTIVGDSSATPILMKFRANQTDMIYNNTIQKPIITWMQYLSRTCAHRVPEKKCTSVGPHMIHTQYTLGVKKYQYDRNLLVKLHSLAVVY